MTIIGSELRVPADIPAQGERTVSEGRKEAWLKQLEAALMSELGKQRPRTAAQERPRDNAAHERPAASGEPLPARTDGAPRPDLAQPQAKAAPPPVRTRTASSDSDSRASATTDAGRPATTGPARAAQMSAEADAEAGARHTAAATESRHGEAPAARAVLKRSAAPEQDIAVREPERKKKESRTAAPTAPVIGNAPVALAAGPAAQSSRPPAVRDVGPAPGAAGAAMTARMARPPGDAPAADAPAADAAAAEETAQPAEQFTDGEWQKQSMFVQKKDDAVSVWVRDTSLSEASVQSIVQRMIGDFGGSGYRLRSATFNGTVAYEAGTEKTGSGATVRDKSAMADKEKNHGR